MLNYQNQIYLGTLYMGTPLQAFYVLFDTGSGPTMVKSSICSECTGHDFQVEESSSFNYVDPPDWDEGRYGSTTLYGRLSTETICIDADNESCATDFQFVAVSLESGLRDYMHGAVGLWNGNVNGYDKKEMLMEKLVADGAISEQTFSFYLDG